MNSWNTWSAHAWPAALLTVVAILLLRVSKHPEVPRGNVVM